MATDDDEEDTGSAPVVTAEAGNTNAGTPAAPSAPPAAPATPAPQGPDISGLVVSPQKLLETQKRLEEIARQKAASNAANSSEVTSRLEADRQRMEEAYKKSAAIPEEMTQKWDSNQKSAEHYTDPVQAFGSVGSVFAMLASSFAGLPMEASLNAGAKAINAIHEGDAKAYEREYTAWKANTDLAVKRHDMERQAYNDATNLMNSNLNAGRTKMELAATKFGDQKVQALLEAGMDKELTDLFTSRNKAALELQNTWDKVQLEHEKVQDLRNDPRYQDPATKAAAIQDWSQRWAANGGQKLRYDAEADYIAAAKRANPNWTPDDLLKWKKDFATASEGDTGASGPLSTGKLKTTAIQELVKKSEEEVAAGTRTAPLTIAEATRQYNLQTSTPSGNRVDDISKQINQYDNGIKAIDRTLAMIDKHVGAVGVAGYATRLGERLGNIAGSNETDRSQIAHDIEYLQGIAPRLLNDSSGRPLSAEASKINRLIAGLNMGDTTANTKRSLGEIRELWTKMQEDNIARREGKPNTPGGGSPAQTRGSGGATPGGSGKMPWAKDPIVKPSAGPRADAGDGMEAENAYG